MGVIGRLAGAARRRTDRLLSRFEDPLESFEYARKQQLALMTELEIRQTTVRPGSPEEANLLKARQDLQARIDEFQAIITRLRASAAAGDAGAAADRLEEEMARLAEDARRYGR